MADTLLTPRDVQTEYGFKPATLAQWRWMGTGPDYIKISPGKGGRIKYKRSAIEAWLTAQTVQVGGGRAA
ncbi:helix-turn-helix transcriptional regulator [Actinacidiphila glaucinigra]|uniref:helix-turn-helix transcriptional regulator n=1 Tax=Actinacidiphila glaucinigra TaxID=235986 RepID=UPI00371771EB